MTHVRSSMPTTVAVALDRHVEHPVEAVKELAQHEVDRLAGEPSDHGTDGKHDEPQPEWCGHWRDVPFSRMALDPDQLRRETGQVDVGDQSADDGDAQRRQRLALAVAGLMLVAVGLEQQRGTAPG